MLFHTLQNGLLDVPRQLHFLLIELQTMRWARDVHSFLEEQRKKGRNSASGSSEPVKLRRSPTSLLFLAPSRRQTTAFRTFRPSVFMFGIFIEIRVFCSGTGMIHPTLTQLHTGQVARAGISRRARLKEFAFSWGDRGSPSYNLLGNSRQLPPNKKSKAGTGWRICPIYHSACSLRRFPRNCHCNQCCFSHPLSRLTEGCCCTAQHNGA